MVSLVYYQYSGEPSLVAIHKVGAEIQKEFALRFTLDRDPEITSYIT
jgi:hypothetical protein